MFRARAVMLLMVVLLMIPRSSLLAEAIEEKTWLRIETAHFTFFTTATESEGRNLAFALEQMYAFLAQLVPHAQLLSGKSIQFFLFQDEDTFAAYRSSGSSSTGAIPDIGYVVPTDHVIYGAVFGHPGSDPSRFVYKQLIHAVLHSTTGSELPLWLRQGIAELYSSFAVHEDEVRVGLPDFDALFWIESHKGEMIPLAELFRLGEPGTPDSEPSWASSQLLYIESWAIVHYLLLGPDGHEEAIRSYVEKRLRGAPHAEAFAHSFTVSEDQLEMALVAYSRQESYQYFRAKISNQADATIKVTRMAPHEVLYHLGDLVLNVAPERLDQAADHLERARALAPEHGPTWADLGQVAELAGRFEEAESAYVKAMALVGDDPYLSYRHGRCLLKTFRGPQPEGEAELARLATALARLERATELDPAFAEAWAQLGYAYALVEKPDPRGIAALERARELLPPERTDLTLNLLLAYARAGDAERVDILFEELIQSGGDPAALGRAREIKLRLVYQQAVRLLNQKEVHDAIVLLVEIKAETEDPALRQHVETQLVKLKISASVLRFAELYGRVIALLGERRFADLAPLLDELRQVARPGRQTESVRRLLARVERAQLERIE